MAARPKSRACHGSHTIVAMAQSGLALRRSHSEPISAHPAALIQQRLEIGLRFLSRSVIEVSYGCPALFGRAFDSLRTVLFCDDRARNDRRPCSFNDRLFERRDALPVLIRFPETFPELSDRYFYLTRDYSALHINFLNRWLPGRPIRSRYQYSISCRTRAYEAQRNRFFRRQADIGCARHGRGNLCDLSQYPCGRLSPVGGDLR